MAKKTSLPTANEIDRVHVASKADEDFDTLGQVINKPPPLNPWVEFEKTEDGGWEWVIWSQNGLPLAISGRGYTRRHDALRALISVADVLNDTSTQLLTARNFPELARRDRT